MGIFSECVWEEWEKTGKQEYVKRMQGYINQSPTLISNPNFPDVTRMVYELMWKGVRGQLKRELVVSCLAELISNFTEIANVIVDVASIIDTETQLVDEKKDDRARLTALVRELDKYFSDGLVKERLEFDFLGESGIVKNPKKFFNTVIKLKTKLFYKQQKFNLFREECEGYAKLITELNQDLSSVSLPYIIEVIKSLIGYFNLDPNRVLDIILESFECQPEEFEFFISLLEEYTPDRRTMRELLNFKFSHYRDNSEEEVTPDSLYKVTALLVQHNIVQLEDIYTLLGPPDEEIERLAEKEMSEAREVVRRMHLVVTNRKEGEEEGGEGGEGRAIVRDVNANNQKFGLLAALLETGAWGLADRIMNHLPRVYCVAQSCIADSLARLIHVTVDPVYLSNSGLCSRLKTRSYKAMSSCTAPTQALTLADLKTHVYPMLLTLGPHASRDPILLYKMIRIFKSAIGIKNSNAYEADTKLGSLASKPESTASPYYWDCLTMLDEVFLPSLSLLPANCCLAEEIWSLVRHFPYEQRYRLYDSWKGDSILTHPVLLRSKATTFDAIKRIMKKVSTDNVKHTGRQLGKLSHSSPGIIFTYILSQIQVASNLIGPVVDSLKYLTSLSFDMLGYCIIESLNDPARERTKTDGTSVSMWLINLSMFCGAVYKKYNIELTGLLQYVANQLKAKHSLDLLIVKEVVTKMGGIEAAEEMTSDQLEAMAGGELLRQEASSFTQVKNTRKSSQRLKDCLLEMNLAVPLVLLMAQQGNCVVYQETEKDHLKLVGKLFDQCHDTLVQFGSFLANNLSQDDYSQVMPPLGQLLSEFHVNPDIAFFLARPMFNHMISTRFEDMRKADKNWKQKTSQEKQLKHAEAARLVMEPVTTAVLPVYPSKIWEDISPMFFTTFWSLTMYDLHVPEELYEKKIKELKEAPGKLHENKELNSTRRKKEAERLNSLMEKMQEEEKRHKEHVERVMQRLRQEKDTWFPCRSARAAKNEAITQVLQYCLFPRSIFTASDASFAAKFVSIIHKLKTPNFSTLICFDRTFCDVTYTVTCCTENEAGRYGRFLNDMLEVVMKWHKDKEVFQAECSGYPGFITKFRGTDKVQDKPDTDTVGFENYRHVCHKWHYKIAKALVVCLESKDYVQIRNALIVLSEIIGEFPLISNLASVLEKRVEKVCEEEKEKRKDLYIRARSYRGKLSLVKSRMVKEEYFHMMKGKKVDESAVKEKAEEKEEEKEEGEIQHKESKKSGRSDSDKTRSSRERESKSRDRKSQSKDRKSESRDRKSASRDRKSESKDRKSEARGEMRPPASRKSNDPDSDRDFKRKRDSEKEKEKAKSPVLDRLEKKEKLRKEKEKEKLKKEKLKEKEKDSEKEKEKGDEEPTKKDRKRDRDDSTETDKKKRKEDAGMKQQNGSETTSTKSRKSRR